MREPAPQIFLRTIIRLSRTDAMVVGLTSAVLLMCGLGCALASLRKPDRAAQLERMSGLCLVAGLAVLGAGLSLFR